jgi:hypothetical protein
MIEDEMKRDPESYDKWYHDFSMFLKEGQQLSILVKPLYSGLTIISSDFLL